ncbi:MAG TPA: site-specific DNA-methyltransferase [Tepidisphaeraceae bacterium]|nr:site-specific DNA-methyltransferase [Tepidisphaeraceae bacterium]
MNDRKREYHKGLRNLARKHKRLYPKAETLYNASGMLDFNQIYCGESVKMLSDWPEEWVDLAFADPPFNIGYLYHGYDDRLKKKDYLGFSVAWMSAVRRALKPQGSFYLAIGDDYAAELCVAAKGVGFHLRNWIIWHYTFGQQTKDKFARSHTHILYFVKDPKRFTFNSDAVRVPSARQTTYKDRRANPKGKLPDDVWFLRPQEAQEADEPMFDPRLDTWHVSRVCGTFAEREGWHGCQMPVEVLKRIVLASSNLADVVLDPFSGSGTTAFAAAMLGRQFVGIDQSPEYVHRARKRIEDLHARMKRVANAPSNGKGIEHVDVNTIINPDRASRAAADVDAFGRPRVPKVRRMAQEPRLEVR